MSSNPTPPYPHIPYQPFRPPPDPLAPARRAAIMMWVLGTLGILGGLCFAAVMPTLMDTVLSSGAPEAQQLRDQMAELESKAGISFKTQVLISGLVLIFAGGVLGIIAFFVRGGGKGGAVAGIIVVSLGLAYFCLSLLVSLVTGGNAAQLVTGVCFGGAIIMALVFTLKCLIQAVRNASLIAAGGMQQQPPGGQGAMPGREPYPPAWPQQPPGGYPPLPPPTTPPGGSFGPAPFGIPPPPDDTGGRYGYATKPVEKPPSSSSGNEEAK